MHIHLLLRRSVMLPVLAAAALGQPALSQSNVANPGIITQPSSYPIYADLVLSAPVIVDATIRSTSKLKPADSPGLAPGRTRFYVEADLFALIRGPQALPARIGYLLDVAPDSRGKLPQLKRRRVLLFARGAPNGPNQLQLVGPTAQRDWTPEAGDLTRRIVAEVVRPDAPPAITGIGNAFHTAGALPGEGETQVFLTTPGNRPVSLGILRRPDETRRWAVSLGEVVDESAGPPARDTLLWYRLACGLPSTLPEAAVAGVEPAAAAIARDDYAFVLTALGPCTR